MKTKMEMEILQGVPTFNINENGQHVELILLINGLRVSRKITSGFKLMPSNAKILKQKITEKSFEFVLRMKEPETRNGQTGVREYSFCVKRLPTLINPKKTSFSFSDQKIVINFLKQTNEPWSPYEDNNLETDPEIVGKN